MGECSIYSLLATQILDLFAERQQRLLSKAPIPTDIAVVHTLKRIHTRFCTIYYKRALCTYELWVRELLLLIIFRP